MTQNTRWKEQFERMKRGYSQFEEIAKGTIHNRSSDYYDDIVRSFFVDCYHLKDWIKNDNTVTLSGNVVEEFINENECLKICVDVCNGLKHLTLTRQRSDLNPKLGAKDISVGHGGPGGIIKIKYYIETSCGKRDAFDIATECVQKWNHFVQRL